MIMLGSKKKTIDQILGPPKEEKGDESPLSSLDACISELIDAIHAKDVEGVKSSLKACLADLDSE